MSSSISTTSHHAEKRVEGPDLVVKSDEVLAPSATSVVGAALDDSSNSRKRFPMKVVAESDVVGPVKVVGHTDVVVPVKVVEPVATTQAAVKVATGRHVVDVDSKERQQQRASHTADVLAGTTAGQRQQNTAAAAATFGEEHQELEQQGASAARRRHEDGPVPVVAGGSAARSADVAATSAKVAKGRVSDRPVAPVGTATTLREGDAYRSGQGAYAGGRVLRPRPEEQVERVVADEGSDVDEEELHSDHHSGWLWPLLASALSAIIGFFFGAASTSVIPLVLSVLPKWLPVPDFLTKHLFGGKDSHHHHRSSSKEHSDSTSFLHLPSPNLLGFSLLPPLLSALTTAALIVGAYLLWRLCRSYATTKRGGRPAFLWAQRSNSGGGRTTRGRRGVAGPRRAAFSKEQLLSLTPAVTSGRRVEERPFILGNALVPVAAAATKGAAATPVVSAVFEGVFVADKGQAVAIKTTNRSATRRAMLLNEATLLRALTSASKGSIVVAPHYYDLFDVKGELYLVMELFEKRDLHSFLKARGAGAAAALPLDFVRGTMARLGEALAFLHAHLIVHAQVTPEHIVLSERRDSTFGVPLLRLVLVDFGQAVQLESTTHQVTGERGSLPFLAPEMAAGVAYGRSVDVWGMGLVLHVLLTGQTPFAALETPRNDWQTELRKELKAWTGPGRGRPALWSALPGDAQQVLEGLLCQDPKERESALEVTLTPFVFTAVSTPLPTSTEVETTPLVLYDRFPTQASAGPRDNNGGVVTSSAGRQP